VEGQEGHVGHLDHLEAHTGNVTHGMALTTETCHQNLPSTDLDEIQTAVVGNKGSDLLAVLDELDSYTFSDSRIWLFIYLHFLKDNSLGVRSSSEGISLEGSAQMSLLVLLVVPFLLTAVVTQFSGCTQTATLACRKTTVSKQGQVSQL
uniref:Uncharacterized protein n=1 Tax=Paramormyrops kingsleyae TaxID=1676925 RepID=A0A3B3QW14_9TELE